MASLSLLAGRIVHRETFYIGEDSATRPDTEFHIDNFLFLIDPFHIVISLSNRSSIEKSIKLFFENEGADCLLVIISYIGKTHSDAL